MFKITRAQTHDAKRDDDKAAAKAEAEQKAKDDAATKEAAEQKAKDDAEQKAKDDAEQKAKDDAAAQVKREEEEAQLAEAQRLEREAKEKLDAETLAKAKATVPGVAQAAAAAPASSGDDVTVTVPKGFQLRLEDQTLLVFKPGVQLMSRKLTEHWYVKANGVTVFDPELVKKTNELKDALASLPALIKRKTFVSADDALPGLREYFGDMITPEIEAQVRAAFPAA